MSKVNAYYHIVFCTRHRKMTVTNDYREDLYRYIWSDIKEHKCELIRISGIPNHIHMLIDLHPSVALSDLMRSIKSTSSGWLKSDNRLCKFEGWAREYFAATLSYDNRNDIIEYIKSQQLHHGIESFDNEIARLVKDVGLVMYEDDFI